MHDDFDDLDWLRDEQPDDDEQGDAERSGLTGQLPWIGGAPQSSESAMPEDDLSFDWMTAESRPGAAPGEERTGLTGALDWLSAEQRFQAELESGEDDEEDYDLFGAPPPATPAPRETGELKRILDNLPQPADAAADDEFLRALGIGDDDIFDDEYDDDDLQEPPPQPDFDDIFGTPGGAPFDLSGELPEEALPEFEDFADFPGDSGQTEFDISALDEQALPAAAADDFLASLGMGLDLPDDDEFARLEPAGEDDFLASLDMELDLPDDDEFASPEPAGGDDFLASLGIDTPHDDEFGGVQPVGDDDFLTSLGIPPADQFEEDDFRMAAEEAPLPADADFLSSIGVTVDDDKAPSFDWFNTPENDEAAQSETPDWLTELGDLDIEALETPPPMPASGFDFGELDEEPVLASVDFGGIDDDFFDDTLDELRSEMGFDAGEPARTQYRDLDALMASFDSVQLPGTGALESGDAGMDFDALMASSQVGSGAGVSPVELSPDAPEWLRALSTSAGAGASAAASVRQRGDRPVDELDERLKLLREEGLNLPPMRSDAASAAPGSVLTGISDTLAPAPLETGAPELVSTLDLSREQQQRAQLLREMTGVSGAVKPAKLSAIDLTYDSPNLDFLDTDFADTMVGLPDAGVVPAPTAEAAAAARPRRRVRRRLKIGRLLVALLITIAVLLPFLNSLLPSFPAVRFGSLPPAQFAPRSPAWYAYNTMDSVRAGQYVLVAVEYGPSGAAELDVLTDALLRHILLNGGRPVLISTNPTGLLRAANLLQALALDPAFLATLGRSDILTANRDYYILRYLPAGVVGLRALASDSALLSTDFRGQPTGLRDRNLADFSLLVLIAERAEDVRAWAEQIAPSVPAPLVVATGYAAAPLAAPYVQARSAGTGGMLVSYGDGYTYSTLLAAGAPLLSDATLTPVPAETEAPPETPEAETTQPPAEQTQAPVVPPIVIPLPTLATEESPAAPRIEPTKESLPETPTEAVAPQQISPTAPPTRVPPTQTPPPTSTPEMPPTAAEAPFASPTPEEAAPTASPAPTEPEFVRVATVNSSTRVNVRGGPGTTFAVVGTLQPGERVRVLGEDDSREWFNILLPTGVEGWIAAFLVDIEDVPPDQAPPLPAGSSRDVPAPALLKRAPAAAPQAAQEATAEPETLPEAEQTAEATQVVAPTAVPTAGPRTVLRASAASTPYREERWYAQTLGIVVIVALIALTSLLNILRGLARRGKQQ